MDSGPAPLQLRTENRAPALTVSPIINGRRSGDYPPYYLYRPILANSTPALTPFIAEKWPDGFEPRLLILGREWGP